MRSQTQKKRFVRTSGGASDRLVLKIASQVSAAMGSEYFRSVTEHLAVALQADCVYVGEFLGGQFARVKTLAAFVDGVPESFEYELAGSASARTALGKPCICLSQAQKLFPSDPVLPKWNAQACVGVPLLNSGGLAIGVIMTIYRRHILNAAALKELLESFAPRSASELERKQQEEQLRQSEERYRAFIELNVNGMWRIEFEQPISTALGEQEQLTRIYQDGYVAECNDALARQLGFEKAAQVIGHRVRDLVQLSNPSVRDATLHAIRSGYRYTTVETAPIGHDGRRKYMLRSQWGIVDDGMLQRMWGSTRDITDLKLSELALDASEQRMSDLLENLQLMVVKLDPKGEITFCNDHLFHLTGWRPSEVTGKSWVEMMIPPEERARVRAAISSAVTSPGAPVHFESPLLGRGGDRHWTAWESTNLRDSEGRSAGSANVGRDLTDFKALETQFHQSQQLESVARLAGRVAHDFNNLLTVIVGYSGVLLEKNPTDSARMSLNEIRKAAEKGADLTQRLFAFGRRRFFRPEVVNLSTLLADDVHMIRHLIGESIQLVTHLDPSLGLVRADPGHIHQIILNLVVNARDAMPSGGTLTVSTTNLGTAPGVTRLPAILCGDFVQLTIADTGTGMTAEVRGHLFEPFYTTKAPGRGTGLGLPTVYGLVQQNGGHIRVETEPDKGTSFQILLPAVTGETERVPDPHHRTDARRGTETILLVEDQTEIRVLAANILRDLGYRVLEAESAGRALEMVSQQRREERIDLLLTDAIMPGRSGSDLADCMRACCRNLRVLLLSAYAGPARGQILSEREFGWLQKPFTPEGLAGAVRELLDQ
jgi:two-component system cell cycle sensor histidine kinase/response regulator CckA